MRSCEANWARTARPPKAADPRRAHAVVRGTGGVPVRPAPTSAAEPVARTRRHPRGSTSRRNPHSRAAKRRQRHGDPQQSRMQQRAGQLRDALVALEDRPVPRGLAKRHRPERIEQGRGVQGFGIRHQPRDHDQHQEPEGGRVGGVQRAGERGDGEEHGAADKGIGRRHRPDGVPIWSHRKRAEPLRVEPRHATPDQGPEQRSTGAQEGDRRTRREPPEQELQARQRRCEQDLLGLRFPVPRDRGGDEGDPGKHRDDAEHVLPGDDGERRVQVDVGTDVGDPNGLAGRREEGEQEQHQCRGREQHAAQLVAVLQPKDLAQVRHEPARQSTSPRRPCACSVAK